MLVETDKPYCVSPSGANFNDTKTVGSMKVFCYKIFVFFNLDLERPNLLTKILHEVVTGVMRSVWRVHTLSIAKGR